MKLDKLGTALRTIKESYGLDMTDLLILDGVARAKKAVGKVTIMDFLESCDAASQATIHKRIKVLCDNNFLDKHADKNNLRNKTLEFGPRYHRLISTMGEL